MGSLFNRPSRRTLDDLLSVAGAANSSDTPEMAEIIRRFEPLTAKVARSINAPLHLRDDLANAARMGLVNAVRRHDGRPGFPAFAKAYVRGATLRELDHWIVREVPATEGPEYCEPDRSQRTEVDEVHDRLAPWGSGSIAGVVEALRPDQRRIAELRYADDTPVIEIAAIVGTSGPAVSQRLATIHRTAALALAA